MSNNSTLASSALVRNMTSVINTTIKVATAALEEFEAPSANVEELPPAATLISANPAFNTTASPPALPDDTNMTVAATTATTGINNAAMLILPPDTPSFFGGLNLTEWCDCVHIQGETLRSKTIVFDGMDLTLPLWATVFFAAVYIYACAFHRNDDEDDKRSKMATRWRRKKSDNRMKKKKKVRSLSKKMRFRAGGEGIKEPENADYYFVATYHTGGPDFSASKLKDA